MIGSGSDVADVWNDLPDECFFFPWRFCVIVSAVLYKILL